MNRIGEISTVLLLVDDAGFDPIEERLHETVRAMIETVFEEELVEFLDCFL